jgi:hypothetical protein
MGIEDINQAAVAMNALTARMNQFVGDADAQIEDRRDAYDAIAADLKSVVGRQMYFTATVNPNEPNPTNVDAGTFNTIKGAIDAAPAGSFVHITIARDVVCVVDVDVQLAAKTVFITSSGAGANPVIEFAASVSQTHNFIRGFSFSYGGSVHFNHCDISLPEKLDPGLPWSGSPSPMAYGLSVTVSVGFYNGTVSGPSEAGLVSCYTATFVNIRLYSCTLDGVSAVIRGSSGCANISNGNVTLINGAKLTDLGTVGTNILQN